LKKEKISYVILANKFKKLNNKNLSDKINRGTFSFLFFLEILEILNLEINITKKGK